MPHHPDRADLESALQINQFELDTALTRQPDLVYRVATELALAISRRDAAKQAVAEIEAVVDAELREEFHGERTTETNIASHKALDSRVQQAKQQQLDLTEEAALWSALRDAFQQRGYTLANLVDLYVSGYFADRSQGRATRDVVDHRAETARERMHESRQNKVQERVARVPRAE